MESEREVSDEFAECFRPIADSPKELKGQRLLFLNLPEDNVELMWTYALSKANTGARVDVFLGKNERIKCEQEPENIVSIIKNFGMWYPERNFPLKTLKNVRIWYCKNGTSLRYRMINLLKMAVRSEFVIIYNPEDIFGGGMEEFVRGITSTLGIVENLLLIRKGASLKRMLLVSKYNPECTKVLFDACCEPLNFQSTPRCDNMMYSSGKRMDMHKISTNELSDGSPSSEEMCNQI